MYSYDSHYNLPEIAGTAAISTVLATGCTHDYQNQASNDNYNTKNYTAKSFKRNNEGLYKNTSEKKGFKRDPLIFYHINY